MEKCVWDTIPKPLTWQRRLDLCVLVSVCVCVVEGFHVVYNLCVGGRLLSNMTHTGIQLKMSLKQEIPKTEKWLVIWT